MKKVLVTGASGFIGSTLVDLLLTKEDYVIFAAIRSTSSKKYLTDRRINFIELDYSSIDSLKGTLDKHSFDIIYHLAGLTKAKDYHDFFEVNFTYTKHLVEAIKGSNTKLIYMSSFAAHGPAKSNPFTQAKESDVNEPNTWYGKSKLKAEEYIKSNCTNSYIILRPTGVYGPRETDYFVYFKTIHNHIDATLGKPKQRLTFIYGKDLCNACFLAGESSITGKTYFVSDGKLYLDTDFARITKDILNTWTISIRFPLWIVRYISSILDFIGRKIGKQFTLNKDKYNILAARNWDCDIAPIENDLHFKADYDLQKGTKEAIQWYKDSKWL